MTCESYDWKAYALGELGQPARREAEAHAGACPACREELAALRLTLDAMSTLREEEIPRRIAFVSDQIFEPRWYQRAFRSLWTPNFAAACVVAGAILIHAYHASAPDQAAVNAQIDAAVNKAVAVVEQQHAEQVDRLIQLDDSRFTQMYVRTAGIVRQ
jgi:anti-sigma factor RsiW